MAIQAVVSHKLRSFLTLLGVLVGVFSIILVMTTMRALQGFMESEFAGLGANTFQVQKWPFFTMGPSEWEKYRRRMDLDYDVFRELNQRITLAKGVGVLCTLNVDEVSSRFEVTNPNVNYCGITEDAFVARNMNISEGRVISDMDVESRRNVCVLGYEVAKKLFPSSSPLGETVRFNSIGYKVIGVLKKKGALFDAGADNMILVPLTTGLNYYGHRRSLEILVEAPSQELFDDTMEQTRGVLRSIRHVPPIEEDDFEIETNDSVIEQFRNITLSIRVGIVVASSIALLAAGVGIMNIMLVSVTERTREIGVRRAIGAKKRNIMVQFIMEAIVLCQIGGIVGVILGVIGGNLAALYFKVPMTVPVDWVIIGLAVCSLVGVTFGGYPAYKASMLDPIESLRHE